MSGLATAPWLACRAHCPPWSLDMSGHGLKYICYVDYTRLFPLCISMLSVSTSMTDVSVGQHFIQYQAYS